MSAVRRAAGRAAGQLAGRWRDRLTARAADRTTELDGRGLLVVAPHPDDETFGCGALIARARAAGTAVTVVVASDGARSTGSRLIGPATLAAVRRTELRDACSRLGVTDVVELGHPDGSLTGQSGLAGELAAIAASRRPAVVLTPLAQDPHPDHTAVHHATVAARRAMPGQPILLGYPVWTWHAGPLFADAPAGRRLGLQTWAVRQFWSEPWWRIPAGPYAVAKQHAVAAYRSQTSNLTGEPGWSFLTPDFVQLFLGPDELFRRIDRQPTGSPVSRRPHRPTRGDR